MRPDEDPGWDSYTRTVLEFQVDERPCVDLARPLTPLVRARFLALGLPGCFGLLTPENPRGAHSDPALNLERWTRFRAELPPTTLQVDGLDPTSTHRERGVALAWSCARVVALARTWEQSAIYWFDGHAMWVIGALTLAHPTRLGTAA